MDLDSLKKAAEGKRRVVTTIHYETPQDALWSRVVEIENGCWIWQGPVQAEGYGLFQHRGRQYFAHRYSYERCVGPIGPNLDVCHACDTPLCVNPAHLWLGSRAENFADMRVKGRARWPDEPLRGEQHGCARLTEQDVRDIRQLKEEGWTLDRLAERFACSPANVGYIVNRRTWSHVA